MFTHKNVQNIKICFYSFFFSSAWFQLLSFTSLLVNTSTSNKQLNAAKWNEQYNRFLLLLSSFAFILFFFLYLSSEHEEQELGTNGGPNVNFDDILMNEWLAPHCNKQLSFFFFLFLYLFLRCVCWHTRCRLWRYHPQRLLRVPLFRYCAAIIYRSIVTVESYAF